MEPLSAAILRSAREGNARRTRDRCLPIVSPVAATSSSYQARTDHRSPWIVRHSSESSTQPQSPRSSRQAVPRGSTYFSWPLSSLLPSSPDEMSAPSYLEFQQKLSPQRDARRSMPERYDGLASVQVFALWRWHSDPRSPWRLPRRSHGVPRGRRAGRIGGDRLKQATMRS